MGKRVFHTRFQVSNFFLDDMQLNFENNFVYIFSPWILEIKFCLTNQNTILAACVSGYAVYQIILLLGMLISQFWSLYTYNNASNHNVSHRISPKKINQEYFLNIYFYLGENILKILFLICIWILKWRLKVILQFQHQIIISDLWFCILLFLKHISKLHISLN